MFSGIVAGTGVVRSVRNRNGSLRLEVDLRRHARGVAKGDSVCVSGVCLTLVARTGTRGRFDVVPETLRRTYLGALQRGDVVNLERSLRMGDEIGGHLVTGHVDGVGTIASRRGAGDGAEIEVRVPARLAAFVFEKGSIAIDGVSLTVAGIHGTRCRIALIPETLARTTLGAKDTSDRVHVEVDGMVRAVVETVRRLRTRRRAAPRTSRSARPPARPRATRASPGSPRSSPRGARRR